MKRFLLTVVVGSMWVTSLGCLDDSENSQHNDLGVRSTNLQLVATTTKTGSNKSAVRKPIKTPDSNRVAVKTDDARGWTEVYFPKAAFSAEVALTPKERTKGLSGRDYMTPGTGMLFVLMSEALHPFWMYGMRFPLDIVWISTNCVVVDITREVSVPSSDVPMSDLQLYHPSSDTGYVLEINAGEAAIYGIAIGDPVQLFNVYIGQELACP